MSTSSDYSDDEQVSIHDVVLGPINEIHNAGSFATSASYSTFPLPRISVEGIGEIRCPLSLSDADSLIRVSRQAPFGRGQETVVDENVRKTWEIDATKVSLSNKYWEKWFESAVGRVVEGLGVTGGLAAVRAEPYKMLLYEKSAMFKSHKDTEKITGMFGTLVICLPSEHTGGEVKLEHGKEEMILSSYDNSASEVKILAWYTDVTHEIQPVHSGLRWVLTYNLISTTPGIQQSAARLDAQANRICKCLSEWTALGNAGPKYLCYVLEHQYTRNSLSLPRLKGIDSNRVAAVDAACKAKADFCVLLANMEKVDERPNGEEYEEICSSSISLLSLSNVEGDVFLEQTLTTEDHILQYEIYESRDPDSQEGGEYLGNQHEDIYQTYQDSVMIICRRNCMPEILTGGDVVQFPKILLRLLRLSSDRQGHENVDDLIRIFCDRAIQLQNDLLLGPVAITAVSKADPELFSNAVDSAKRGFDTNSFALIGEGVGFPFSVIPEVDLVKAFSKFQYLYEVGQRIKAFQNGLIKANRDKTDDENLVIWLRERLCEIANRQSESQAMDAGAIIKTALEYDGNFFQEVLTPFIARFIGDPVFTNSLAVEVLSFAQHLECSEGLVEKILRLICNDAVMFLNLDIYLLSYRNSEVYPYSSRLSGNRRDYAKNLFRLFKEARRADLKFVASFITRFKTQIRDLKDGCGAKILDELVIPFVAEMLTADRDSEVVDDFLRDLVRMYIQKRIEPEPTKPPDWSRPDDAYYCYTDCNHCKFLRDFLRDPTRESCTFGPEQDTTHINNKLKTYCNRTGTGGKPFRAGEPIVVTKTLKQWEEERRSWGFGASMVEKTLKNDLPEPQTRLLLGEEYNSVVGLHMLRVRDDGNDEDPSQPPNKRQKSG